MTWQTPCQTTESLTQTLDAVHTGISFIKQEMHLLKPLCGLWPQQEAEHRLNKDEFQSLHTAEKLTEKGFSPVEHSKDVTSSIP